VAELVLGPLLRHVGKSDATVWVETDSACEVDVLGQTTPTFAIAGHHYALVVIDGLTPATTHEYRVKLGGIERWPLLGAAPSVIRTLDCARPFKLAFGSCRIVGDHQGPDTKKLGVDALRALPMQMRREPPDAWPDALLLLGDQVYAHKLLPATRAFARTRRHVRDRRPRREAADFEEYTRLNHESWSDPRIRWLLSTLPSAMIFDDHEVHGPAAEDPQGRPGAARSSAYAIAR